MMFLKIDEVLFQKIKKTTMTDYDTLGDFIPSESIEPMLEDLLLEIDRLEEKIKDIEQDREDNYRPISYMEQIGYSERDFY